jgi:hypothetical protein
MIFWVKNKVLLWDVGSWAFYLGDREPVTQPEETVT